MPSQPVTAVQATLTTFARVEEHPPHLSSLVDLLRWRAAREPDRVACTFLADGETEDGHLTYGELDQQARALAAQLQFLGLQGERALLLHPQSLEYIVAFFGCLFAGVVAVPLYLPRLKDRSLSRIQAVAQDAKASVVLTTAPTLAKRQALSAHAPELGECQWLATEVLAGGPGEPWRPPPVSGEALAYLQYTSGSTGDPRGVMVSHGNLLSNLASMYHTWGLGPSSILVSWTPLFHDMGLIMGILLPLYGGFCDFLMPPAAFLQRPFRWLQAISRHRATFSFGPNFAFDLCARKIPPEQRALLDLRCWSLAINGAEPVRPETLDAFATAFGPCGFRRDALYPGYGLAEATVAVSCGRPGGPPAVQTLRKAALDQHEVTPGCPDVEAIRRLAGCGTPLPGQRVVIVDPESRIPCPPHQVGEIWVSGPSVTQGYWQRTQETEQTFRAHLADTGEGQFLRTGDLGFLQDGELFLTGRIKDLIIIRGENHYPQDIELTVERSHPALRPGCGAAFSIEVADEERLVVVQEVEFRHQPNVTEVTGIIRQAVAEEHGVQVGALILVKPGSIPKTSSGKIQRRACRAAYLAGRLEAWEPAGESATRSVTVPA